MIRNTLLALLTAASPAVMAAEEAADVLAKRGKATITQQEFDARMAEIPARDRAPFLRDGSRLETLVANLLLSEQLAVEAREAGFDQSAAIQARMELAAQRLLAQAWLEHYIESQGEPDMETLAREYYALHPEEFMSELEVDVSHLLISQERRPQEEALELAMEVALAAQADPSRFDELILEHTEDPSVATNRGHFTAVKRGDMVKPFEEAAFSLEPGVISEPVHTSYGYHVIRVDAVHQPRVRAFEEVKGPLMQQQRKRHRERLRNDYLSRFTNLDVEMPEEAVRQMLSRYFNADALSDPAATESE